MADHKTPFFLKKDLTCVIDIETSGPRPYYHELLELKILPITAEFEASKVFPPLHLCLKPVRVENIPLTHTKYGYLTREKFKNFLTFGVSRTEGIDLFDNWYSSLNLCAPGRIIPYALDWIKMAPFIEEFLAWENNENTFMSNYFHKRHSLDVFNTILFFKLLIWFNGVHYDIGKCGNLNNLLTTFSVDSINPINTYANCINIARLLKKLLKETNRCQT